MAYIGKQPVVGNFQVCDAISVVNGQDLLMWSQKTLITCWLV
jgi:hypothetical protein